MFLQQVPWHHNPLQQLERQLREDGKQSGRHGPLQYETGVVKGQASDDGFAQAAGPRFEIASYSEHALSAGEEATAIAYIQVKRADGRAFWGAAVDTNIELASVRAVLSALNRAAL